MVGAVHRSRAAAQAPKHQFHQENKALDKTRLCRFFEVGRCTRGKACSFAHGESELVPQPDLFRTGLCFDFVKTGRCRAGAACKFAHNQQELRLAPAPAPAASSPPAGSRTPQKVQEQILSLQQQAAKLNAQLAALREVAASCVQDQKGMQRHRKCGDAALPRQGRAKATRSDDSAEDYELPGSLAWSRQSTCEEPSTESYYFDRQAKSASEDWDALSSSGSWSSGRFGSEDAMPDMVLVVKNTFVEVELAVEPEERRPRRSQSAPPSTRA